jgi:hypothetical protein
MKEKVAIAIAALMLASTLVLGTSTVTVSAQGTSVSVTPTYTGAKPLVLEVTVTNNTGTLADTVLIRILKDGTTQDWGLKGLAIIPKGENVLPQAPCYIARDNRFTLEENLEPENYYIPVDSRLKVVGKPTDVYIYRWSGYTRLASGENLLVSQQTPVTANENIEIGENLAAAVPLPISVSEKLAAADNIYAYWINISENILAPVDNALLLALGNINTTIPSGSDNRAYLTRELPLSFSREENAKALESKAAPNQVSPYSISSGDMLRVKDNLSSIVGTLIELAENTDITIPTGCTLIGKSGENLKAENGERIVTLPVGWSVAPSDKGLLFTGRTDNLPAGATRTFKFAADLTGVSSGVYTVCVDLYVGTTWIANSTGSATIEVDSTSPVIKSVTATPVWAKRKENVNIQVVFSEPVTVENVTIKEKNGEEAQLAFTSTDNITWTATYVTGENENRDGPATIYFAKVKDRAGNDLADPKTWDNVLFIDRVPPGKIDLTQLDNWPGKLANKRVITATVYVKARKEIVKDNYQNADNLETVDKVVLKVGTTEYQLSKDPYGDWCASVTLPGEGIYYMALYAVDKAGNVGAENGENIVCDLNPPAITILSPENNLITKDNTPLLKVTITDLALGLDNDDFSAADNHGLKVELRKGALDGALVIALNPKDNSKFFTATIDNTRPSALVSLITGFTFENEYSALEDNDYYLVVFAGDNVRADNRWVKFTIDTRAPPPLPTPTGPSLGETFYKPVPTRDRTLRFGGSALGDSAKVKIYVTTDDLEWKAIQEVDVKDGSWRASIDLSSYQGKTLGIAVAAVDRAGNESDRTLYGYLIYDASAPTVSITSPKTGTKTSKASIEVTGTVTKDSWEDWSDITLRIQVGTGAVTVPVSGTEDTATFSYSVALSEGTNTILVYVSDGMNSSSASVTVTRTVTPWGTYAVVLVIIALIIAAIAILRVRK